MGLSQNRPIFNIVFFKGSWDVALLSNVFVIRFLKHCVFWCIVSVFWRKVFFDSPYFVLTAHWSKSIIYGLSQNGLFFKMGIFYRIFTWFIRIHLFIIRLSNALFFWTRNSFFWRKLFLDSPIEGYVKILVFKIMDVWDKQPRQQKVSCDPLKIRGSGEIHLFF